MEKDKNVKNFQRDGALFRHLLSPKSLMKKGAPLNCWKKGNDGVKRRNEMIIHLNKAK